MNSIRWPFLAAWIHFALAASAFGGEYSDPSGFSFTYPNGWVAINRASMGDMREVLPEAIRDWVTSNNVDLSRVAVVLLRDAEDEFLENLNVVVDEKQQIPVKDSTVKQLTEMMPKQYESMGINITSLKVRIEKVGDRDAIVVDYRTQLPGVPSPLRQKQVMFPGGGKTYTVTCTMKDESHAEYRPVFDKMLASFKMPEPKGFAMNRTLLYAVIGGAGGALLGGLTWIVKKLSRKDDTDNADE